MDITDFLSRGDVIVEDRVLDKAQLLKELSRRAAASLHLKPGQVAEAVLRREKLGSTGIGAGVAIPHARFGELTKPFGLLARLKTPIDFEAVDGRPVDVVFLLLAPTAPEGDQLNALACIARTLRNPDVISGVHQASDGTAVHQAVTAGLKGTASDVPSPLVPPR